MFDSSPHSSLAQKYPPSAFFPPCAQIRTFDFVADPNEQFRSKPHPYRSTVAHKGTAIFDPESETVVYDMASVEDPTMRSYFLSDTRLISCGFKVGSQWGGGALLGRSGCHHSPLIILTLFHTFASTCHSQGVVVWSAEGNSLPDKYHTTHDAVTSCHFSGDDRLCVMGTQDGNLVVYDAMHSEAVSEMPCTARR